MGSLRLATLLAVLCGTCGVVQAADTCYPSGAVAGIVVATVVVTCVVGMLTTLAIWKYWWSPRKKKAQAQGEQQQQRPQKTSSDFAFDNPYFRNQEGEDSQGKAKSSFHKNSLRSSKQSDNLGKSKKGRGGKNHFVFGGAAGRKQKALDDTCVSQVERTFVNLRGHDFTGLGFNICGNMRDGILVKDVLHRGPASESGLIKAGDKIVNVTVSFTSIVYEDALTILSYASPYDVQLEIERTPDTHRKSPGASSSGGRKLQQLGSCSFTSSGQKLFHPLYRSQSIDDLTQIDGSLQGGPRRSQSVGVAAHRVLASSSHFRDKEERTPMSLVLSTTGSLNEKMLANVMGDGNKANGGGLQWEKKFEDTLESDDATTPQDTPGKKHQAISQVEVRSDAKGSSRKKRDDKQFLDCPRTKLNLETRMILDDGDIQGPPQTSFEVKADPMPDNRRGRREEEEDSDVSRDSLEVSQRAQQLKKKASPGGARHHADVAARGGARSERVYANTGRTLRVHTSSLSSNEEIETSHTGYTTTTESSTSYGRLRDVVRTAPYKSTSQPTHADSYEGHKHSRVEVTAKQPDYGHGVEMPTQHERGAEGRLQSHGRSSNRIVNSTGQDSDVAMSPSGYSGQRQRPDEKDKSQQQKLAKRPPNPGGGTFTQINPFQHPSKQKQPHSGFKPRIYRGESNGDFSSRGTDPAPSPGVHTSSHSVHYKHH